MKETLILSWLPFLLLSMSSFSYGKEKLETATFAGGCFWCVQPVFDHIKGVRSSAVGYANGRIQDPTYQDYAEKGYVEAVQVVYDPAIVSYKQLLETFWKQIDPTDTDGQFVDRGKQYRPAIFWHDEAQKKMAVKYRDTMAESGMYDKPVNIEISEYINFYPAETYHQEYHIKAPVNYNIYRSGSGRDNYIKKIWGDFKTKDK